MSRGNGRYTEALQAWGAGSASGWAVAPRWFRFFRLANGTPWWVVDAASPVEVQADLSDAYDLRLFDSERCLTWRYEQRQRAGRWSTLTDTVAATRGWSPLGGVQQRLIAGTVAESAHGWSLMAGAAGTGLWVPVAAPKGASIAQQLVEYVSSDDRHGNRAVAAERVCGWEKLNGRV
mgnify:CR=1 FL=1